MRHEGVELVHGVLVLVPQPGEPDANAEWDAPVKQGEFVSENEGMNRHLFRSSWKLEISRTLILTYS